MIKKIQILVFFLITSQICLSEVFVDVLQNAISDSINVYTFNLQFSTSDLPKKDKSNSLQNDLTLVIKSDNKLINFPFSFQIDSLDNELIKIFSFKIEVEKDLKNISYNLLAGKEKEVINSGELTNNIINFKKNRMFSSIGFAYFIDENLNNEFKDTMFLIEKKVVIPNPSLLFTNQNSEIYVYNTVFSSTSDSITFIYNLLDGAKRSIYKQTLPVLQKENSFQLVYTSFMLPENYTGTYIVSLKVLDNKGNTISEDNKALYYINQEKGAKLSNLFKENLSFEESPYSAMSEDDIDIEFKKMKPILTLYETEQYNMLSSLKAKQRAIFKYWNNRDTDSLPNFNKIREEFEERVNYSNNTFLNSGQNGWATERGRVVRKYGIPSHRNIVPSQGTQPGWEEWFYDNVDGGLFFYFVERFSPGNMVLVHSNGRGEPQQFTWARDYNINLNSDIQPRNFNQNPNQSNSNTR